MDLDGDNDVIALQNTLYWYEAPTWIVHSIPSAELHDFEVLDIEGDGDCDIAGRFPGELPAAAERLCMSTPRTRPPRGARRPRSIPEGEGLASPISMGMKTGPGGPTRCGSRIVEPMSRPGVNTSIPARGTIRPPTLLSLTSTETGTSTSSCPRPSALATGTAFRGSRPPMIRRSPAGPSTSLDPAVEAVHHFVGAGGLRPGRTHGHRDRRDAAGQRSRRGQGLPKRRGWLHQGRHLGGRFPQHARGRRRPRR